MNSNKGFTLIELVVVIVILGILAVTAVPRFIDLSTEAEAAALQGVAGAMGSGMAVNYAACAAGNADCVTVADCDEVGTVLVDGALPTGYTVASQSLGAALGDTATCVVTQTSTTNTANFTGIFAL